MEKKRTDFVVQGGILAIAGILVRIIGILYRIPLTNIIGVEGIMVYQTAYQIYSILLLLSSYSLPLAVSKLVSARMGQRKYREAYRIFRVAVVFALIVGTAAALITYFFADFFAGSMLNAPEAALGIRTLAPTVFIMAILGVLRGYYQGMGTMIPTAISQIVEQIINAVVSVAAAYFMFNAGRQLDLVKGTSVYAVSRGAAGGTIGTGSGALAALVFCLLLYLVFRRYMQQRVKKDRSRFTESYGKLARLLVLTIVPVIVSTALYNLSTLVDQGIYGAYCEGAGLQNEYRVMWGAFSGEYSMLVMVPVGIASALASSIIPSLTAAVARRSRAEVIDKIQISIRFAMVLAIPSAVGLAVLATPIMLLLFSSGALEAGKMMLYGSAAVVFFSLSTVTNAILQGLGHMNIPVRNSGISLIIHAGVLAILLWVFHMGSAAVIIANMLFPLLICILNARAIHKIARYRQEVLKTFLIPIGSALIMGVIEYFSYQGMYLLTEKNSLSIIVSILLSIIAYGVVLILLGGLNEQEMLQFPMGGKLAAVCRKLHLFRK